jgi:molybdenum cofactor cytidylyltransferase
MQLQDALSLHPRPDQPAIVCFVGDSKSSALFRLAHELTQTGHRVIVTTTTPIAREQMVWAPAQVAMNVDRVPVAQIEQALDAHGWCLLFGEVHGEKVRGARVETVEQLAQQAPALRVSAILVAAEGLQSKATKASASHEVALPASTTLLIPVLGLDAVGIRIEDEHAHHPELMHSLLDLWPETITNRLTPQMAARLLMHPEGWVKLLPPRPEGARLLPLLNQANTAPHLATARLVANQLATMQQSSLIGSVAWPEMPNPATLEPVRERWGPLTAVVLAAGQSLRMGRAKQLEAVDGEPMVLRAVKVAVESGADDVLVVTGAYAVEVAAVLSAMISAAAGRVRLLNNPNYQRGQAGSIRAAVQALPATGAAALFLPVDQPFLSPALLRRMVQQWRQGAPLVATKVDGEIRGAPAVFDHHLWPALLQLEGDIGARPLFRKYKDQLVAVPAKNFELRDIDKPEDLTFLQTRQP